MGVAERVGPGVGRRPRERWRWLGLSGLLHLALLGMLLQLSVQSGLARRLPGPTVLVVRVVGEAAEPAPAPPVRQPPQRRVAPRPRLPSPAPLPPRLDAPPPTIMPIRPADPPPVAAPAAPPAVVRQEPSEASVAAAPEPQDRGGSDEPPLSRPAPPSGKASGPPPAAPAGKTPGGNGEGSGSASSAGAVPSPARETVPSGLFLAAREGGAIGVGKGRGGREADGTRAGASGGTGDGVGPPGDGQGSGGAGSAQEVRARGAGRADGRADLLQAIRRRIEAAKVYPDSARRAGLQGTAVLRFRIDPEGSPHDVEILRSSGHPELDDVSRETIRRAAPYPVYPGWVRFTLPYRLDR